MTVADSDSEEILCCLVRGVVQGVGFRYFVMREAMKLGLRGTVRNTNEGAVEVVAAGSPCALEQLEQCLRVGPELAEVCGVEQMSYEGNILELSRRFMIIR